MKLVLRLLVLPAVLLGGCTRNFDGVTFPIARSSLPLPPDPGSAGSRTDRHFSIPFAVAENRPSRINAWFDLNPDCSVAGTATVRLLDPPMHGTMIVKPGRFYPNFPKQDQRYSCNLRPRPGIAGFYRPVPGYTGRDSFTIAVITPTGSAWTSDFHLEVK